MVHGSSPSTRRRATRVDVAYPRRRSGFTLIELALVGAIAAVLAAIALPSYRGHLESTKVKRAIGEIRMIEAQIAAFEADFEALPPFLAAVGADRMRDPWGNPYRYLRIDGPTKIPKGKVRKDKNLVPINTDYDLYSVGPDGETAGPLTAKHSRDDVVRANDGAFVGIAADY